MFQKLKELLEAGKITQELADSIDSEISTALKIKNNESANWRVKYQDLNKSFESISKTKDELETKLSGFDDAIRKAKEDGKGELVTELETQRASMQELQSNLEVFQNENKSLKIESALNSGLSKYEAIDNELVGNYVKSRVVLDGDNLKYKDGENSLTLEDGLKKFFEDKPHLLKAKGNSGSGAGDGNNSGGEKSFKDMTLTEKGELYKNNPQEYERLKIQG